MRLTLVALANLGVACAAREGIGAAWRRSGGGLQRFQDAFDLALLGQAHGAGGLARQQQEPLRLVAVARRPMRNGKART